MAGPSEPESEPMLFAATRWFVQVGSGPETRKSVPLPRSPPAGRWDIYLFPATSCASAVGVRQGEILGSPWRFDDLPITIFNQPGTGHPNPECGSPIRKRTGARIHPRQVIVPNADLAGYPRPEPSLAIRTSACFVLSARAAAKRHTASM